MATLKVELPELLHGQLRELVAKGWFPDEAELVREAIRRFLESRSPDLMARSIQKDVEWGLRGDD